MNNIEMKESVRVHYAKAAENRRARLKTSELNPAKHNHNLRYRVIERFFSKHTPLERGIDIGTGTGVWAEFLSNHCVSVHGIDFVQENIEIARQSTRDLKLQDKISYFKGDVETISFANTHHYDVALMISVLQHLPNKIKALTRVFQILKPSGVFILLVHNRNCIFNFSLWRAQKSGQELPINEYSTLKEIQQQLLEAGFRIDSRRSVWFFLTDTLFMWRIRKNNKSLSPIRKVLISFLSRIELSLSSLESLNFLFREILFVCSLEKPPAKKEPG